MSIYEERRRIIQNQTLIQLLIILAVVTPIPLGWLVFKLVFCVAPVIMIPSIVVIWAVGSVSYIVMWLHVERQNVRS